MQANRDLAGVAGLGREEAVPVDGARSGIDDPVQVFRKLRLAAGLVDADRAELHRAAGRIDLVVRLNGGVVKLAVAGGRGDHQQRRSDLALRAVGGRVANRQTALTLVDGGERSRAAAVEIERVDAAESLHDLCRLIDRHTDGIRLLTAVSDEGRQRAVGLQADRVARPEVGVLRADNDLAVLDQIERAGDRLEHIGIIRAVVADGVAAVLQNGKIRLLRVAVAGLNEVALHNQVTERLKGLHIVVVAVRSEKHLVAGCLFIGGGLLGGARHAPVAGEVLRGLLTAVDRTAGRVIAVVGRLERDLRVRRDRADKACDLRRAVSIVHKNLRFRHALRQGVFRLGNQIFPLRRRHRDDRSGENCRADAQQHGSCQEQRQAAGHAVPLLHDSTS